MFYSRLLRAAAAAGGHHGPVVHVWQSGPNDAIVAKAIPAVIFGIGWTSAVTFSISSLMFGEPNA